MRASKQRLDLHRAASTRRARRRGAALIMVLMVGLILVATAALSLGSLRDSADSAKGEREVLAARLAAQSGISEALARLKFTYTPSTSSWVRCGDAEYFYTTTYTAPTHTIRCFGRTKIDATALAQTTLSPESVSYVRTGWLIRGLEAMVVREKNIPNAPFYVGNGGVEKGRGGFAWTSGADPNDPSTWSYLGVNDSAAGSVDSYQSRDLPFRLDARDHPIDFLDTGTAPDPAQTPHPFSMFASQTLVGQHNASSWMAPWVDNGGVTRDPSTVSFPDVDNTSNFPTPADAFPLDQTIPDVQEFVWNLYQRYGGEGGAANDPETNASWASASDLAKVVHITSPSNGDLNVSGSDTTWASNTRTIGSLANPKVVFATGELAIDAGKTLKGYGILIIRDDYHPTLGGNTSNNQPSTKAALNAHGNLEWTGLVLVAGWAPSFRASDASPASNHIKINGALFGEDSVMSGGEVALDAAQIQFYIGPQKTGSGAVPNSTDVKVTYSRDMFEPGGMVYELLPEIDRRLVYLREL